jgi:DNA-binding response OmpR family regulator
MRVLLVEDDRGVAEALAIALRRRGYEVLHATTAAEALAAPRVEMILLDLGLPDGDGVEVCRTLRDRGHGMGIIAVTARGDERDKVAGLRSGADDYMVKPISAPELHERIMAVLRRLRRQEPVITIGGLRIDLAGHRVTRDEHPIPLTRMEFELLVRLARAPGVVVGRDELLIGVWGTVWPGARHSLDVHMATLRRKLAEPGLIETVRGVGYRLSAGSG